MTSKAAAKAHVGGEDEGKGEAMPAGTTAGRVALDLDRWSHGSPTARLLSPRRLLLMQC